MKETNEWQNIRKQNKSRSKERRWLDVEAKWFELKMRVEKDSFVTVEKWVLIFKNRQSAMTLQQTVSDWLHHFHEWQLKNPQRFLFRYLSIHLLIFENILIRLKLSSTQVNQIK